jgi:hypothetical protein
MRGYIYIASAFETVNRSKCGPKGSWVDNDPHFWTSPPTWGICRNDLRAKADVGDYIFFCLPRRGRHPQTIFGFMQIEEKISHTDAFVRPQLRSNRMSNKIPNGNIIVERDGKYNRFDGGTHKYKFEKIKRDYAIGSEKGSRMLSAADIQRLAPQFLSTLGRILGTKGDRAIDHISRKGRVLTARQVVSLLFWLNNSTLGSP